MKIFKIISFIPAMITLYIAISLAIIICCMFSPFAWPIFGNIKKIFTELVPFLWSCPREIYDDVINGVG